MPSLSGLLIRAVMFIVGSSWIAATAWLDWMLIYTAYQSSRASSWPQTTGRVVDVKTEPCEILGNLGYERYDIAYEYDNFSSTRYRMALQLAPLDAIHRYDGATGEVTARYDPRDPSQAVLAVDLGGEFWFGMILGAALTCIASFIVSFACVAEENKRKAIEVATIGKRYSVLRKGTGRPLYFLKLAPTISFCDAFMPVVSLGVAVLLYSGRAFDVRACQAVIALAFFAGATSSLASFVDFHVDPGFNVDIILDKKSKELFFADQVVPFADLSIGLDSEDASFSPALSWASKKVALCNFSDRSEAEDFTEWLRGQIGHVKRD